MNFEPAAAATPAVTPTATAATSPSSSTSSSSFGGGVLVGTDVGELELGTDVGELELGTAVGFPVGIDVGTAGAEVGTDEGIWRFRSDTVFKYRDCTTDEDIDPFQTLNSCISPLIFSSPLGT